MEQPNSQQDEKELFVEEKKWKIYLLYVGVLLLIGQYAVYIDMGLNGIENESKNSGSELLLNVVVYYYLFKRLRIKPYVGAIVGALMWFVIAVIAGALAIKYKH